jgi:tripartite-type tricarboxylate transporter receptor subunit TctC
LSIIPGALVVVTPGRAQQVADFYSGKTIRIVNPTGAGGSYGFFSQLAARHIGRFIPGSPAVVVQSMPGAGGLLSLNYLGNSAPRDGTVLTLAYVTIIQNGLFNPKAKFDPAGFQWVGRFVSVEVLGVASQKSGVRSLEDARRREVVVGSAGLNNIPGQAPLILNRIAGTRFKIISGYTNTGQAFIALERGEVDVASTSTDTFRALYWDRLKSGEFVPIFLQGSRRMKEFPQVPTLLEFANEDAEKAFLRVFSITADIGRSLATPPGVPKDRLEALRTAFDRMIVDPAFKADVAKLNIDLNIMSGAELQDVVAASMRMSSATRDKVRKFYDDVIEGH